jgi:hypothetical protein
MKTLMVATVTKTTGYAEAAVAMVTSSGYECHGKVVKSISKFKASKVEACYFIKLMKIQI